MGPAGFGGFGGVGGGIIPSPGSGDGAATMTGSFGNGFGNGNSGGGAFMMNNPAARGFGAGAGGAEVVGGGGGRGITTSAAAAAAVAAALEAPPALPTADAPTEAANQETFTLPDVFQNQQHLQAPLTCAHGVSGLPQQQQPRDRVHQVQPRDRVVPSAPCAPLGGGGGDVVHVLTFPFRIPLVFSPSHVSPYRSLEFKGGFTEVFTQVTEGTRYRKRRTHVVRFIRSDSGGGERLETEDETDDETDQG